MASNQPKILLQKPSPDFESFKKVLRGEKQPEKVYFTDYLDQEVMKYIAETYMNKKWIPPTKENRKEYLKQMIDFYYRMGNDSIFLWAEFKNLPQPISKKTADTAILSRGERQWLDEEGGLIKNWNDFEKIDWDRIEPDLESLDYVQENLPEGMKITPGFLLFQFIYDNVLGMENLFILSHDEPELVEAVFEKWGRKIYEYYKEAAQYPGVGAIFHSDDLGFKTATMVNPDFLRKHVFPWHKKYASLAHERGKMYWFHCCGYKDEIIEDLVEDVGIDALHSFEDSCCPVIEYKRKYGDRIAILGGVDMDKLVRMSESNLREYVRKILDVCMPGRYALGSGNTVANYIPVKNYLAMLDEGLRWQG